MKMLRLLLTVLVALPFGVLSAGSFTLESKGDGAWSDAATWQPERQPKAGDKVHIRSGHAVVFDSKSSDLIPFLHIEGSLVFACDRDTELNVAVMKVGGGKEKHSGIADVHGTRWYRSAHAWKWAHLRSQSRPGSRRGSDCTSSMDSTRPRHRCSPPGRAGAWIFTGCR